ncbi:hypothetical protein JW992_08475 [candidate division KSB1 bacterium]|nr:hypothetical protein [candidate division KSB1 bacterium]
MPDTQLDAFSEYVVQNMEQADKIITISVVTAILIAIILLLLCKVRSTDVSQMQDNLNRFSLDVVAGWRSSGNPSKLGRFEWWVSAPEFQSTHPFDENRIRKIKSDSPKAIQYCKTGLFGGVDVSKVRT